MKKIFFLVTLSSLFLSACGEFAYKRGASAVDLNSAQKACQQKGGGEKAVMHCLEEQGWFVSKLDGSDSDDDLLATATVSDNRGAGYSTPENSKNVSEATVKSSGDAAQNATSQTAPPTSPNDTFKVSSWWKLGGGQEDMNNAKNQCVAELGDDHKPDPTTQKATRAFIKCMRTKGWRGLATK